MLDTIVARDAPPSPSVSMPSTSSPHPLTTLDKRLPQRISQYLAQQSNQQYVTTEHITDELRNTYPEYKRKPYKLLLGQVQRVCELKREEALKALQQQKQQQSTAESNSGETPTNLATTLFDNLNTIGQPITASATSARKRSLQSPDNSVANGIKRIDLSTTDDDNDDSNSEAPALGVTDSDLARLTGNAHTVNATTTTLRSLYGATTPVPPNNSKMSQDSATPQPSHNPTTRTLPPSNQQQPLVKRQRQLNSTSKAPRGQYMGNADGNAANNSSNKWQTTVLHPTQTLDDVGGIEHILTDIRKLVGYPLLQPQIFAQLGVSPPRGILLHGAPGVGKSLLAHAIAGEYKLPLLYVSAPELVAGMSGESEHRLRQLFADAQTHAPCLLFIDEIDAVMSKRDNAQRGMEQRIVAQFLTCMDALAAAPTTPAAAATHIDVEDLTEQDVQQSAASIPPPVIVLAATNRPDALDSALRRAGRFDREIAMPIPDADARQRILQKMAVGMALSAEVDFKDLGRQTVGYVGADLKALIREAATLAIDRIFEAMPHVVTAENGDATIDLTDETTLVAGNDTLINGDDQSMKTDVVSSVTSSAAATQPLTVISHIHRHHPQLTPEQLAQISITQHDFIQAIKKVQPSAQREGFATVPDVTWNDIGALDRIHDDLELSILMPIKQPELFSAMGLTVPVGVLLYGPPGCGKTLVAKAIANESGASFLSVKGPELLNQYVGQSEKAVRTLFQRARTSSPAVIFFDEIDSLAPNRSGSSGDGNNVSARVVNQLLTELDGLDDKQKHQIYVIAATNRPDIIDPALLRPGRLDKLLYVGLPDQAERAAIIRKQRPCQEGKVAADVNTDAVAADARCDGFSGADCAALVREAGTHAVKLAMQRIKQHQHAASAVSHAADVRSSLQLTHACFEYAFSKVSASVSKASRDRYDRMSAQLRGSRSVIGAAADSSTDGST